MILVCSAGHEWNTDDFQTRFYHPQLKAGGRCPAELSYDRLYGSQYCRRVLRQQTEPDKKKDRIGSER